MTTDELENKIEGILNDFENGISDKNETTHIIGELIAELFISYTKYLHGKGEDLQINQGSGLY